MNGNEAHLDGLKLVTYSATKASQKQQGLEVAYGHFFRKVSFKTSPTLMHIAGVEVEKVTLSNTGASFD